jgi:hypothetical protein
MAAKKYRVRRGYAVHLKGKIYTAGQIVMLTDEEYEKQKWKVEAVRKTVERTKNTALK